MDIETIKGLKKYQNDKRESNKERVTQAVEKLQSEGKSVNFKSVSEEAGISRKTLYKVEEFKILIQEKRGDKNESFYKNEIAQKALEIEKLQRELEALKESENSQESLKDNLAQLKESLLNRSR